jgi:hypothetical protein
MIKFRLQDKEELITSCLKNIYRRDDYLIINNVKFKIYFAHYTNFLECKELFEACLMLQNYDELKLFINNLYDLQSAECQIGDSKFLIQIEINYDWKKYLKNIDNILPVGTKVKYYDAIAYIAEVNKFTYALEYVRTPNNSFFYPRSWISREDLTPITDIDLEMLNVTQNKDIREYTPIFSARNGFYE